MKGKYKVVFESGEKNLYNYEYGDHIEFDKHGIRLLPYKTAIDFIVFVPYHNLVYIQNIDME